MSSKAKGNPAFEEALDDIHTRFILNLPDEELSSAPRIFFQVGMTCARSPSLRAMPVLLRVPSAFIHLLLEDGRCPYVDSSSRLGGSMTTLSVTRRMHWQRPPTKPRVSRLSPVSST